MNNKSIFKSVDEFIHRQGEYLGTSENILVTQDMINAFADVTKDNQWIHVDEQRSKYESPFGITVAHGYLTLSLLINLLDTTIEVRNISHVVNYGIDKLLFLNPVIANSNVCVNVKLKSAKDLGNICLAKFDCQMLIVEQQKIAFEGVITLLYYFNQ